VKKINNYKQLKQISEEILKNKGVATAKEVYSEINDEYTISRVRISPKKVSSYLRPFSSGKKDKNKVLIFKYKD